MQTKTAPQRKVTSLFKDEKHPCKAYDVETKSVIAVFDGRGDAARHFNIPKYRITASIINRGSTLINDKWIAFRNA